MKRMTLWSVARDTRQAIKGGSEAVMARSQARLAELVAYARAHSPYFAGLYRNVPETGFNIRQLPPTEKGELMSHFDEWVTDKAVKRSGVEAFTSDLSRIGHPYLGKYLVCTTSGTTGTPALLLHDNRWLVVNSGLSMAHLARQWLTWRYALRMRRGMRFALISSTNSHLYGITMVEFLRRHPRRRKTRQVFSVFTPLPQLVDQLNEFQPTTLNSFPTMLVLLAREQLAGRLRLRPAAVLSSGEKLSPQARSQMESAWGKAVWDLYVTSETGYIGFQCRHGQMHVSTDWLILEPVDQHAGPVPPGKPSQAVLVTSLANRIQPIIRYKMNDSVTINPEPCACGNPMPAIRVEGRADEILTFATPGGGTVELLPEILRAIMDKVPDLYRWQIIQTGPSRIEVRLQSAAGVNSDSLASTALKQLGTSLTQQGLAHIITALSPEPLRADPVSGKFQEIYRGTGGTGTGI